jgi:hypothetical protein
VEAIGLRLPEEKLERTMRLIITLAVAGAGIALAQSAAADTLRCGSVLIHPGDDGNFHPIGFAQLQRWRIAREPGQFPALLTIGADGRVETIEFERRRN